MNSLNLAQLSGYGVGHIDHPGTPVQTTGALVIKFFYTFAGEKNDMAEDVLSRPEYYLGRISIAFILMTGISLFIIGIAAYKKFKSLSVAALLQLSPLYPSTVYNHLSDVSSESLFIVAILLFIALLIGSAGEKDMHRTSLKLCAIIFGIICGFGLACKIIFFPLLIIPLIMIRRFSFNMIFLAVTVLSFLAFVFPAISSENADKYANWILGIATHTGKYGTGSESVIESSSFLQNLVNNITQDISFNVAYMIMGIIFVLQFLHKYKVKIKESKYYPLLAAVFISMTLQILIVMKQYDQRYMIPAYLLSVTGLLAACFIAKEIFPAYGRKSFVFVSAIIIFFSCFRLVTIINEYSVYSRMRSDTEKLNELINEKLGQQVLVRSGLINNMEYCLYFGTNWAGTQSDRYRSILKKIYPDFFYYDRYAKDFFLTDRKRLKSKLDKTGRFLYLTDDEGLMNDFLGKVKELTGNQNVDYEEIYSNDNGEKLYEVILNP